MYVTFTSLLTVRMLTNSIECEFFIAALMKILVLRDMTALRTVYEIKVSEEITASFFRGAQDFCLGYPSDRGRNIFQHVRAPPYTNLQTMKSQKTESNNVSDRYVIC